MWKNENNDVLTFPVDQFEFHEFLSKCMPIEKSKYFSIDSMLSDIDKDLMYDMVKTSNFVDCEDKDKLEVYHAMYKFPRMEILRDLYIVKGTTIVDDEAREMFRFVDNELLENPPSFRMFLDYISKSLVWRINSCNNENDIGTVIIFEDNISALLENMIVLGPVHKSDSTYPKKEIYSDEDKFNIRYLEAVIPNIIDYIRYNMCVGSSFSIITDDAFGFNIQIPNNSKDLVDEVNLDFDFNKIIDFYNSIKFFSKFKKIAINKSKSYFKRMMFDTVSPLDWEEDVGPMKYGYTRAGLEIIFKLVEFMLSPNFKKLRTCTEKRFYSYKKFRTLIEEDDPDNIKEVVDDCTVFDFNKIKDQKK